MDMKRGPRAAATRKRLMRGPLFKDRAEPVAAHRNAFRGWPWVALCRAMEPMSQVHRVAESSTNGSPPGRAALLNSAPRSAVPFVEGEPNMSRRDDERANEREIQDEALAAWDRRQRFVKRRLALGMGVTLVIAFAGAVVVGRAYGPSDGAGPVGVAQHR
jgi:hypothetical protein